MPVQKWFSWAGRDWFVPSVYVCSKGIVVDFCMRAEASALRGFMEKWGIDPESDESIDFSRDEREQMEREQLLIMTRLNRHGILGLRTTPERLSVDVINKYLEIKHNNW